MEACDIKRRHLKACRKKSPAPFAKRIARNDASIWHNVRCHAVEMKLSFKKWHGLVFFEGGTHGLCAWLYLRPLICQALCLQSWKRHFPVPYVQTKGPVREPYVTFKSRMFLATRTANGRGFPKQNSWRNGTNHFFNPAHFSCCVMVRGPCAAHASGSPGSGEVRRTDVQSPSRA